MKFDEYDVFLIVVAIFCLVLVACFYAPFFIRVAKDMWQWALA